MTSAERGAYVSYRLQRANETIAETRILIENRCWNP